MARWVSFWVAAAINAGLLVLNVVVLALQAWHGAAFTLANEAAAAVCALGLWSLIAAERRLATEQAIRDSYLQEQLTDTKMKAFMLEQVEAGKAGLGMTMSTPGPAGRSH